MRPEAFDRVRAACGWDLPLGTWAVQSERPRVVTWWNAILGPLGFHTVVCAPRCRELHMLVKAWRLDMHDLRRCILYSARGLIRPAKSSILESIVDFESQWLQGRCGLLMRFVGLDEKSGLRATSLDSQSCVLANWGIWGSRRRTKDAVWLLFLLKVERFASCE